ncbi:MAG: hypothetical protein QOE82_3102 [Thermoanaerobaculia bacterium]|jgi:hypothetical protein|nr:hypothetical protein [Thermoanaerobaculia bacterium]
MNNFEILLDALASSGVSFVIIGGGSCNGARLGAADL